MKKRVVNRKTGWPCLVLGAAALAVHAGCTNTSGFPDALGEAGAKDGKLDGKLDVNSDIKTTPDGAGVKETGPAIVDVPIAVGDTGYVTVDSPVDTTGIRPDGAGGAGGNPGTDGGKTDAGTDSSRTDGAIDAPQAGASGGGGAGGIATTGGRTGTGGTTQGGTGGSTRDAGVDVPADRPPDGPGSCSSGYHACRNTCVVNGSTDKNSCGNNCTVCQAPTGGSVTCNGTSCVQSCPTGSHLCNGTCVDNKSAEHCGGSCNSCRVPDNSSPTCDGTNCGFTCNSGAHKCGNNCYLNADPNHCGTGCEVCAGDSHGSPVCQNGACAVTCSTGSTGSTGYHWCDNVGICIADNSTWPGSCGNACKICPTATGATRTCDGAGNCDLVYSSCQNGLVLCGTDCVAPDDKHCGPSCSDCTTRPGKPTGAHGTCNDGVCGWTCDSGYNNCNPDTAPEPRCVSLSSTDPDSCAGSCTPCPTDANGTRTCTNRTCGLSCGSGGTYHVCGTGSNISCERNDDVNNCGSTCRDCTATAPAGTTATCVVDNCTYTCDSAHGYRLCGSGPSSATCEKNDEAHCGASCQECGADQTCNGTACEDIPDGGVVVSAH